ncbi:MAG TPA: hypothetical protein VHE61_14400 [Opitutaceae bacterium]|nr:hypothetical protein [Opitutaceae bacterium]
MAPDSGGTTRHRGEDEIVSVARNGRALCPLIAARCGRFHVQRDARTNREQIVCDDGRPLSSTTDLGLPPAITGATRHIAGQSDAMSPEAFEAEIVAAVSSHPSPVQP